MTRDANGRYALRDADWLRDRNDIADVDVPVILTAGNRGSTGETVVGVSTRRFLSGGHVQPALRRRTPVHSMNSSFRFLVVN